MRDCHGVRPQVYRTLDPPCAPPVPCCSPANLHQQALAGPLPGIPFLGLYSQGFLVLLLAEIVDTVLEEDDLDNDGYITYPEYVFARKREEARDLSQKVRASKAKDSL